MRTETFNKSDHYGAIMSKYAVTFVGILFVFHTAWAFQRYGERYCHDSQYTCITIKRGDSWAQMFPNPVQRDLVKRVNRMNVFLQPDMVIAVPKKIASLHANDLAPFAHSIRSNGEKLILVDLSRFAWASYDESGHLLKWGPASPGTKKCLDVAEGCSTPSGSFRVTRKDGVDCASKTYPHRISGVNGGGEMPWCVYFYKGFALHGSSDLPGYEASYGCLRLFIEDAKWLNEQFVDLPSNDQKGTQIIIREI